MKSGTHQLAMNRRRRRMKLLTGIMPTSFFLLLFVVHNESDAFQPHQAINLIKLKSYSSSLKFPRAVLAATSDDPVDQSTEEVKAANANESMVESKPKLSKQEEILQNALNIQPESSEEKSTRQAQIEQIEKDQAKKKTTNIFIAILSFSAAVANYVYQYTHPITDVQLLYAMSQSSTPLTEIGTNGKPTVVDFWAPWCENCKRSASTLSSIEKEYGDSVNFVMVNGDEAENWELIERFRVDAIPHLALISKEGYVETALIGPIPKSVLEADLDVLIGDDGTSVGSVGEEGSGLKQKLPYTMFDAFQGNDNMRKVSF